MTAERILICGGRVVDPANGIDAALPVYLADGKILAVGEAPDGFQADRMIEAEGQIVCPGFVDLCARLREPGEERKATIAGETAAAAAGGVTTLCVPPDVQPVIDTPAVARLIQEQAARAGKARVLPIGALTQGLNGKDLSEMKALRDAGCPAVGNARAPLASPLVLRRALEYAANWGLLVVLRPVEPSLRDRGCVHEGAVGARLGLPGIPASAETVAVAQALALIEQTGARAHFGQLSSARAVALIERAQAEGLPVTADVAIHQLHLTEAAIEGFNALCHVDPPFRSADDLRSLRDGVAKGVIGAICSDHQPHDLDAKLDAFSSTEPGVSSLETLLPLALRLIDEGVLSLSDAIARLTCGPARILGLEAGALTPGARADLCVFDPDLTWCVEEGNWLSGGRNTPWWKETCRGKASCTIVAGCIVHKNL
jgi:dihydroorotase